MGKSCTASSLGIPQGLTAARVLGRSGAMQTAFPPRLISSVGQSTRFVILGSLVRIRHEAQRKVKAAREFQTELSFLLPKRLNSDNSLLFNNEERLRH